MAYPEVGDWARRKDNPTYGWAKVLEILPPKAGLNTTTHRVAKVEWTVGKGDKFGFIKYFALRDLIREV